MNFCVIKRHYQLLESYKISVGDEIVILTGEGLNIGRKTRGSATSTTRSPIWAEMELRKRNRRMTGWAVAN